MNGFKTFILISLITAGLVFLYWRQRGMEERYQELEKSREQIRQVRQEVEDLRVRVEQTSERVEARKDDEVEAEASVRRIRKYAKPPEYVFHIDEQSGMVAEGAPPPAPAPEPTPGGVATPTTPQPSP